jgi:hypothetical protein
VEYSFLEHLLHTLPRPPPKFSIRKQKVRPIDEDGSKKISPSTAKRLQLGDSAFYGNKQPPSAATSIAKMKGSASVYDNIFLYAYNNLYFCFNLQVSSTS